MENAEIAAVFDEIADLLELQDGNRFRVRSYRSAARTVRDASRRMADLVEDDEDLSTLPNIGKRTEEKIRELVERGKCRRLEDLRKKSPAQLTELLRVSGLGPKKVKALHGALGVQSLDDLQQVAEAHRVRNVKGMGVKTEERILHGIDTLKRYGGRIGLREAQEYALSLGKQLDEVPAIQEWEIAGSFRRRKETVGDLDVLVEAKDREDAAERLTRAEAVADVVSHGTDKVRVRLGNGLAVDFQFFEKREFGSALLYFTGSKAHGIALRKRARSRGWKLNEHGLFHGRRRLAGESEAEVYEQLGLPLIPPELREDRGELEAAEQGALPELVELDDIRGDLHVHTTASDGKLTIEEIAEAAKERGYEYLAITDHSKAVRVANGLDEDRLRRHADQIREISDRLKGLRLLAGVEVDILEDGRLDLAEQLLDELDWVNASVHSHFGQSKKKMTERVLKAIRSGVVDCLAHPLGRQIGIREPIPLDLDRVLDACVDADVCLEINAYPDRLDLPDVQCQRAKEGGVRFVISTDAHKADDLDFMLLGVNVARRGWLEKKDVLNTSTLRTVQRHAR